MKQRISLALLTVMASSTVLAEKEIIGWVEPVSLNNHQFTLPAKIDTGADTSSLDARNIKRFTKWGKRYVSFEVVDQSGKAHRFEKPIVRLARIRQRKNCNGGKQRRIVINFEFCIGHVRTNGQVNLVDRAHFRYPLLIGRNVLRHDFLVDSGQTNTHTPSCKRK